MTTADEENEVRQNIVSSLIEIKILTCFVILGRRLNMLRGLSVGNMTADIMRGI